MLENKNNMDYFYLEDERPQTSPHNTKFKINRVNNFISTSGPASPTKEKSAQKAHYNIFNFTKLNRPTIKQSTTKTNHSHFNITKDEQKVMNLIHTVDLNNSMRTKPKPSRNKRHSFQHIMY